MEEEARIYGAAVALAALASPRYMASSAVRLYFDMQQKVRQEEANDCGIVGIQLVTPTLEVGGTNEICGQDEDDIRKGTEVRT